MEGLCLSNGNINTLMIMMMIIIERLHIVKVTLKESPISSFWCRYLFSVLNSVVWCLEQNKRTATLPFDVMDVAEATKELIALTP
jgi:hypothetical protein